MVVFKHVRASRAASEPVEPVRLIDLQAVDTARRISMAARDDTDEMMLASKRHDQQLLSDINAKLANRSFLPPPSPVKRASAATFINPRKPPISPAVRTSSSIATTSAAAAHRRLLQNLDNTSDDVYTMPPTPVTRSVIRASSLPPPSAAATRVGPAVAVTVDRGNLSFCPLTYATLKLGDSQLNGSPTPVVYSDLDSSPTAQNGYDKYGGYVRTRVTDPPARLTPVTDLAIRQAHRDLDRIERELKYSPAEGIDRYNYIPKSFVTVTPVENLTVRRPLPTSTLIDSLTPSTTTGGRGGAGSSLRVRAVSLSPVRSAPTSAAISTGYRTSSHFSPSSGATRRRTSPVRPSELIALMTIAPTSTKVSDSKLSSKLLSELEQKPVRTLTYRAGTEPRSTYNTSSFVTGATSPVIRHSDFNGTSTPISTGGRPKISDARRKVREVLCKVKKDPYYFD